MEHLFTDFNEGLVTGYADNSYYADAWLVAENHSPKNDDGDDDDNDDEDDDDKKHGKDSGDEQPVDKDVVQSPVVPQTGGKPTS